MLAAGPSHCVPLAVEPAVGFPRDQPFVDAQRQLLLPGRQQIRLVVERERAEHAPLQALPLAHFRAVAEHGVGLALEQARGTARLSSTASIVACGKCARATRSGAHRR
jgi:hypothetical protein